MVLQIFFNFSFSFIVSALTDREVVQITRETNLSEALVPVVASVVSGIFILAALTFLIVFYKRYTQRCGGQLQGSAAGESPFRHQNDHKQHRITGALYPLCRFF